ncbi:MAG TPA: tRNA pseudouridine(38-40) synthase TruA [Clostridia bacterium]|nr:tRNA pseudouridine(38-40) synthase TruA [Clostridia bacterium]
MKRNIKITIEYDGTNYGGWQRQTNSPSIQEEIEEGLLRLTGERIIIEGAGRTDSGVHARGQVANFITTRSSIRSTRFARALNTIIPEDIRILKSEKVANDFHSRYCAKARHYRYSIINRSSSIAIGRDYHYPVYMKLDKEPMIKAVELLKGTYDFRGFCSKGSEPNTTIRTVYDAKLSYRDSFFYFDIIGNAFLYNMVRIIVGTLIDIGKKKIPWEIIQDILDSGDRGLAGATAPSRGLCLEKVYYNTETDDFVLDTLGTMY